MYASNIIQKCVIYLKADFGKLKMHIINLDQSHTHKFFKKGIANKPTVRIKL